MAEAKRLTTSILQGVMPNVFLANSTVLADLDDLTLQPGLYITSSITTGTMPPTVNASYAIVLVLKRYNTLFQIVLSHSVAFAVRNTISDGSKWNKWFEFLPS